MEHKSHSPETDEQALDTIFTLLGDRRRRDVVDVLSKLEPSVPLYDLATAVTATEPETESDDASAGTAHDVAATLHHVHLPKLDRADVIDYDTEANTVTAIRTATLGQFVRPAEDGQ